MLGNTVLAALLATAPLARADWAGNWDNWWHRPSSTACSTAVQTTQTAASQAGSQTASQTCGYAGGAPTVTISAGVLHGTTTSLPAATATVNQFLGVPFAQSPPLRFAPAVKANSSSRVINATAFSPSCPQQFAIPGSAFIFNNPAPPESEDCLYLNVYTPSTPAPADGRPVLFWIYGGALQFGNAGQHAYDGSWFASYEDVIVVTTNYRTNVFGFPSSPELPSDGHNLGFLDQRLALQWVQDNIHLFGGSKNKVTIFGESAGAFSVDALLTSFPANSTPPFRGAILESGQYSYRAAAFASSAPSWYALSDALGCPGSYSSNLTCLRAANVSSIINTITSKALLFNPYPDNKTLVSNPAAQRLSGNIAKIPVLGGTNAQEGRVFEVGQQNLTASLNTFFGNNTALKDSVAEAFKIPQLGINAPYDQISQIFTELVFQCPAAKWANDTASVGIPAWRYYFNSSFTNTQALPGLGVYHSSEIEIVYGTYANATVTTQENALSQAMMGAWAKFARNPNYGPGWNRVGTGASGSVLVGASANATSGVLTNSNGTVQAGFVDLGLWGNRGDALSAGITVIEQSEVDFRCHVFDAVYALANSVSP
ncbi:hypothetical protein AMS68_002138 [Peltaster fructicola]|uniref:Carboxylic ester hydrolase n=1 Tax=Peltaster fructicola TaxID=286661 RepID=A0A6H0XPP4_9PEZI|nr:hypothetical protein AMS68_002138 [Peltaster fructicola]